MSQQQLHQAPPNAPRTSSQPPLNRPNYPPQGVPMPSNVPMGNMPIRNPNIPPQSQPSQIPLQPTQPGHPSQSGMPVPMMPSRQGGPPPQSQGPQYQQVNPAQMAPGSYPIPQSGAHPYRGMNPSIYYQQEANKRRQQVIKEEIATLSYTVVPESLEELYAQKRSAIYRGLFNYQNFGGKREKKNLEPAIEATTEDFMLTEMVNMAIDFDEERLHKRISAIRLAREAQRYVIQMKTKEQYPIEQQVLTQQDQIEQEQQQPDFEQPKPIEIDPESNKLQIRVSLSGIFNVGDPLIDQESQNDVLLSDVQSQEAESQSNFFKDPFLDQPFNYEENKGEEEQLMQINTVTNEEQKIPNLGQYSQGPLVIYDLRDVQPIEEDALDKEDLFYTVQTPTTISLDEIDDQLPQYQKQIIADAKNSIQKKYAKFDDIIYGQYTKKEQEKQRRKKHEELMQAANRSDQLQVDQQPIQVENLLLGNQNQPSSPSVIKLGQSPSNKVQEPMNIDLDLEKPKIKLYIQHDIIQECFNPQDFQDLVPLEQEVDSDEEIEDKEEEEKQQKSARLRQRRRNVILRPQEENYFSDEDFEFINHFPDTHDPKFLELIIKMFTESMKKNAYQTQHSSNDLLLHPEKLKRNAIKSYQNALSLNPVGLNDIDQVVKAINSQNDPKKTWNWNPGEIAFIKWYVSMFGDEWKLISDVVNYHPLTRGRIRDPEEIRNFFFTYNEHYNLVYHKKIQISPYKSCGMPLLLNQRPPSLFNSVQQQCYMHQNSIKIFQKFSESTFKVKKYYFKEDKNEKLYIISEQDYNENQEEIKLDDQQEQLLPKKRGRPRKKKLEEEVLEEQKLKDNEKQQISIFDQIEDEEMQDQENQDYHKFYAYQDKLFSPSSKRRKTEEQIYYQDDSTKNYEQSPMMTALTRKFIGRSGEQRIEYVKSVLQRFPTIFFLAYLYKKIHQSEKEMYITFFNQPKEKLEEYESNFKHQLEKRFLKLGQDSHEEIQQKRQGKGQVLTKQEKQEKERQDKIKASLQGFKVDETLIEPQHTIGKIWGTHSIFYFDQQAALTQPSEEDAAGDRAHDFLKQTWEQKWESMDSYWFQQHKHLNPREKKQDLPERYFNNFYQMFTQQQPMGATPRSPRSGQPYPQQPSQGNIIPQQQVSQVPVGGAPQQQQMQRNMQMGRGQQMPMQGNPNVQQASQPRPYPNVQGQPPSGGNPQQRGGSYFGSDGSQGSQPQNF